MAHADVGREARHAAIRQLLIAIGDDAADGRWARSLGVAQARADGKLDAVWHLDQERAQASLVLTGAFLMADDPRLSVVGSS